MVVENGSPDVNDKPGLGLGVDGDRGVRSALVGLALDQADLAHLSIGVGVPLAGVAATAFLAVAAVTFQIDALYNAAGDNAVLPAEIETAAMTRLRRESHARMLGNGPCTRAVELECRMESACETCAYFRTGPEFVRVLLRQRDHARTQGQTDRAALFAELVAKAST
jgi:hypothetical protein